MPVGTQVLDADEQLVADLAAPGARVVLASGGEGGRGNKRFATPTRQAPRFAETGMPGDEADYELRLKLLADAALVGLPNAGKSSLLARISNAKPKVADYPFTTLQPVLGTVDSDERQLVVADVPGLIEGASEGVGLGHEFLAHLERARLLVHLIDAAAGDPGRGLRRDQPRARGVRRRPGRAAAGGRAEQARPAARAAGLRAGRPARRPRLRALGRDRRGRRRASAARSSSSARRPRRPSSRKAGCRTSSSTGPKPDQRRRFRILRTDRGFRVHGTPGSEEELERALREVGAKLGDEVEVEGEVLEFQ